MRAVFIEKPGSFDVLKVREIPAPQAGPREVLIAVRAAGINFADVLARQGIYPAAPPYPCCVGYEVSGTVIALGAGVDAGWMGREVLALTDFNSYAEQVAVGIDYVWEKPAALTHEQAAAIPLNYITAWGLLIAMGGLKSGETVLIHNAGGGVGLAALEISRQVGAVTIGTASPRKHEFLRAHGLDHVVDYTRDDWPAQVLALTQGKGVELAIDPIGGANWKKTYSVLRPTGRMGMFGISGAATSSGLGGKLQLVKLMLGAPLFHPAKIIPANRGVFGINIHSMYGEHEKFRAWMKQILLGVEQGWVRPHVDKVCKLDEAGEAHRHIEARGNIGKVLLVP